MAIVKNNTARLYNLKCITSGGNRVAVRLVPGLNSVDESVWENFVNKKTVDVYVKSLMEDGVIEVVSGPAASKGKATKSQVKSEKVPALSSTDRQDHIDLDFE